MDGQWGPYEYCNPVKTNDPHSFSCQATYAAGGFNMNASCSCPRMNVTVGWENKTEVPYTGDRYICYHGECYNSHYGDQSKAECQSTCKPPPTPPPSPGPPPSPHHHSGGGKSMGSWFSHPANGQW
jgi:hypothetical protein